MTIPTPHSQIKLLYHPADIPREVSYRPSWTYRKRGKKMSEKILIVDDDESILKSMGKCLTRDSFVPLCASDPETALYIFSNERPALALVDIRLPRGNGLDVVKEMQTIDPSIPAILISGNPAQDFILRGLKLGAADFLIKPIDGQILKETVRRVITERHKAQTLQQSLEAKETEIKEIQKELSQTAKMSALGELAAGLAHEINQPLTALKLTCQDAICCLESPNQPIDEVKESLKEMLQHIDMISGIVRHMRAFTRTSDGNDKEELDINEIIRGILSFSSHQLRAQNISVQMELMQNLPHIKAQAVKLQQVLMNLISNARDALLQAEKPQRVITLLSELHPAENGQTEIWIGVQDNAGGIPLAIQKKLFMPFFTTKGQGQGTGLGLSISKKIIQGMGGRLEFTSRVGEGSTFVIALPLENSINTQFPMAA